MDYVRLYTTLHDDNGMKRLSDRAFRYYINALSWCGLHETSGVYEVFGSIPKAVRELVVARKFEPTDDPSRFAIHGWAGRQTWELETQARRAKARKAAQARWSAKDDAQSQSSMEMSNAFSNAQESRGEESRGEDKNLPSLPRRDEVFEAVAEVCGIDWHELTPSARGSLNKAVADIKPLCADAAEVRRRAANWTYDVPLTPPTLAKHWPALGVSKPRTSSQTSRLMALADELEAR